MATKWPHCPDAIGPNKRVANPPRVETTKALEEPPSPSHQIRPYQIKPELPDLIINQWIYLLFPNATDLLFFFFFFYKKLRNLPDPHFRSLQSASY